MKLLISDIDGSLLPFGQNDISPVLLNFFKELLQTPDIRLTFATGKPFARALPFAQTIGITLPLICANGALIKHPVSQEILFCKPLPEKLAGSIIDLLAQDARCQLYPEVGDTLFYVLNPAIPPESWRHTRPGWIMPRAYDPHTDMTKSMGGIPHKIGVSTAPADRAAVETLLQERFQGALQIFHPKPDVIDLTSLDVNKGTAATWLTHYLNLATEDVIAIGDEMNDLSLFQAVGWRIARNHAPPELLKHADVVIEPGDNSLITAIQEALT